MKRILFAMLLGAMLTGQLEAAEQKKYIGTYFTPNALLTGLEKQESAGGVLAQPDFQRVVTSKTIRKNGRQGTMITFDITKKMQGEVQAGGRTGKWEIKESADETGAKKFTLCLDRKFFLPGGLEKPKNGEWGPAHTGNITYQDNMICFDLTYEVKPLNIITSEMMELKKQ